MRGTDRRGSGWGRTLPRLVVKLFVGTHRPSPSPSPSPPSPSPSAEACGPTLTLGGLFPASVICDPCGQCAVAGGPQFTFAIDLPSDLDEKLSFRQWESVSQRAPTAHVRLIFTMKIRPFRPLLAPCRRCVRSQCVSHVSTGKGARVTQDDRSSLWHHRPTRTTPGDGSTHLAPHGTRTDEPCWAWR